MARLIMAKFVVYNRAQYAATLTAVTQGMPVPTFEREAGPEPVVVAILSTTLLQSEGVYQYTPLTDAPDVTGISHYVGHPATRHILDFSGAVYTPGLFAGLQVGQAVYVAQLKDPRKGGAFTVDAPNVGSDDLKWGMVIRLA